MVRKATLNDIDELVKIRMDYLHSENSDLPEGTQNAILNQLPEYFKRHLEKDLVIYLAEVDEKVVSAAFLLLQEKPAGPKFLSGLTGMLMNVYTKPEYRRRGLAKTIVEQLIEVAKQKSAAFIELKATKDGFHLYKELGFEVSHSCCTAMELNLTENAKSHDQP